MIFFPSFAGLVHGRYINENLNSNQVFASQLILSNYTLVTQTGNSNFYIFVKEGAAETEYSITTGAVTVSPINVKYDLSDNKPSFLYASPNAPYNDLRYLKLTNGIWSGNLVGNLGPSIYEAAIDLKYDPNDNLPACVAYDSQNYDLNYYKYNGSSFIKTTILNGGSTANLVSYASLNFDTSDNYPMINFIEGDSSILKSAKYNGTTWTTTNINTFNSSYNKRYITTEFTPTLNQPIVLMGGNTSGLFMNVRDSSNIWKSGRFASNTDVLSQKPEIKISEEDQNNVYIAYVNDLNQLVFIEKYLVGLIDTNWTPNLDSFDPKKLSLVSGENFIDINKKVKLEIDSDFQPVVLYKKDNIIKYIKNTGAVHDISTISFSGDVNFKNINNSNNYSYDIEFFKDSLKVYQTYDNTFKEYKSPYQKTSSVTFDPAATVIYSSDTKINPTTNQPNIVLFSNTTPQIRFSYPNNNQRSSWTTLKLPSGSLNFSGTNLPATLMANHNCNFDFDKVTNQPVISVFGYRGFTGTAFLIKKDLEGSGYQYYNTPYTGYYAPASDFKINPITNKYCLAISNEETYNKGLKYYEMDPNTNTWITDNIESSVSQSNKIYLDFTSGGYPMISYLTQSGVTGYLKLASYNGVSWTRSIIETGANTNEFYFNSFQYNSGEDYYGISYKAFTFNNSGFYISNKGGTVQKYNLGNQHNQTRIPYLIFKKYKNEVRPFVLISPTSTATNFFHYLDNESFVTGQFKNDLIRDMEGDII